MLHYRSIGDPVAKSVGSGQILLSYASRKEQWPSAPYLGIPNIIFVRVPMKTWDAG